MKGVQVMLLLQEKLGALLSLPQVGVVVCVGGGWRVGVGKGCVWIWGVEGCVEVVLLL